MLHTVNLVSILHIPAQTVYLFNFLKTDIAHIFQYFLNIFVVFFFYFLFMFLDFGSYIFIFSYYVVMHQNTMGKLVGFWVYRLRRHNYKFGGLACLLQPADACCPVSPMYNSACDFDLLQVRRLIQISTKSSKVWKTKCEATKVLKC